MKKASTAAASKKVGLALPNSLLSLALDRLRRDMQRQIAAEFVLVRGNCDMCLGKRGVRRCPVCAVLQSARSYDRDADPETVCSQLLMVPWEWLQDFLRGWDWSKEAPDGNDRWRHYPHAHKAGRQMAAKLRAMDAT